MRKPSTGDLYALDARALVRVALAGAEGRPTARWAGAWRWTTRAARTGAVEHAASVDVAVALLAESGTGVLVLAYELGGRAVEQHVTLEPTPCHFGGHRWWGRCPACARRVALLYGPEWRCRACHGLAYRTAQLGRFDRLTARMRAIQRRLDPGFDGVPWAHPPRPRGMHWPTYLAKLAELDGLEERRLARLAGYLEGLSRA